MFIKGSLSAQRFITAVDMTDQSKTEEVSRQLWMRIWSRVGFGKHGHCWESNDIFLPIFGQKGYESIFLKYSPCFHAVKCRYLVASAVSVTGYRLGISYACTALRYKPAFIAMW